MELIAYLWPRRGTREPTHVDLSSNPPALPLGVRMKKGSGTVAAILEDVLCGTTLRPNRRTRLVATCWA
jgi:hypothetical protein